MSQVTLSRLIGALGPEHVTAFFLVLARVTPLFILAPLFSSRMIPARVRTVVAVGLSIGLTAVASHGRRLPSSPFALAALLLEQLLVGLGIAFAIAAVFAAAAAAGALLDTLAGFSFGALIDPVNGNMGGALTNVYGIVGLMMFIAIGGDAWTLRGLARTFELVPLGRGAALGPLASGAEQAVTTMFTAALEVAAPAVLALLITDVAFGMVSKVVPQLNVFAVGFPTKVGVALLAIVASVPFLGGWLSDAVAGSVAIALHSLRV